MRPSLFARLVLTDSAWPGAIAAGLPVAYACAGAAPFGHFGDAPAFAASAIERPTTVAELLARLCAWTPLGPISLRLSLASALWLGLLAALLYRAIDAVLRAQGVSSAPLRASVGVGLCWLATASLYADSVIPGAVACTAALMVLVLGELSTLWLVGRARPWLGIGVGLLLAQDASALALLAPALLVGGIGAPLRFSWRGLAPGAAAVAAGALLRVRSGSASAIEPGWSGALTLLETHPGFTVSALLGAIAVAQTRTPNASPLRRVGLIWTLAWLACLGLGAGATAGGVLIPIGAVLTAGLAGALAAPDGARGTAASVRETLAAAALCGVGLWQLQAAATAAGAATFVLPEAWSAASLDRAPPRALVLSRDRLLGSLALAARAEAQVRPDLRIIQVDALAQPAYARSVANAASLRPLVRSYLLQGELIRSELESLSAERPVWLDPPVAPELTAALRPAQLWYEVAGSRVTKSELRDAAERSASQLESLSRAAEPAMRTLAGRSFLERVRLGFGAPNLP